MKFHLVGPGYPAHRVEISDRVLLRGRHERLSILRGEEVRVPGIDLAASETEIPNFLHVDLEIVRYFHNDTEFEHVHLLWNVQSRPPIISTAADFSQQNP